MTGLFFRAWEKYRFPVPYLRFALTKVQEATFQTRESLALEFGPDPDSFTRSLFNLIGLGSPALRHRLHVDAPPPMADPLAAPQPLARIDDLALLHYAGLFAHKPRNAVGLQAIVRDYFGLPARVEQFTGQWLYLEPTSQSRLPDEDRGVNCESGGERRRRRTGLGRGQ